MVYPTTTSGTTGTENETAASTTTCCSVTTRSSCSCGAQQGRRLETTVPTGTATDVPRPRPPPNFVVGNFFPRILLLFLLLLLLQKKNVVVGGGRQGCLLCGFRERDAWIVFHLSPTRESMRWICHGEDTETTTPPNKWARVISTARLPVGPGLLTTFRDSMMARLTRVLYRRG